MASKTTREVVWSNWGPWNDDATNWSHEQLQSASLIHIAQQTERTTTLLQQILSRLDTLGADGIHTVVREARHEAMRQRAVRLRRERAARQRRKTRRKGGEVMRRRGSAPEGTR